jgi:membrane protease subunit (stomatin/prohibitin family)
MRASLADVFTPGLYMLETNNMPIMTTLQHWDHGFRSPFKSEIYFVNTTRFTDLKWGTKNPIMLRDPEFGPTRIRAYGTYTVRVTDPAKFLTEIVGTDGEFTMDEISFQIRNIIVQEFSRASRAPAFRCSTWPPTPPIWASWWRQRFRAWSRITG